MKSGKNLKIANVSHSRNFNDQFSDVERIKNNMNKIVVSGKKLISVKIIEYFLRYFGFRFSKSYLQEKTLCCTDISFGKPAPPNLPDLAVK